MDAFPNHYVDHNLPLLLVSGLEDDQRDAQSGEGPRSLLQEGGFRLRTDLPPVQGQLSQDLLRVLLECDSSSIPWNGKYVSQADNKICFRIQSIGRLFTLPPRKAPPPPHSPRLVPAGGSASPPPPMILHSVLSPLTPSSPLYADGLMSPLWIAKHQSRLPSVFVSVFGLSSDPNTSTLLDNKIKSEISKTRSVFTSANYKTKLVFVLLGDDGLSAAELEDRVVTIRRATTLDSKSLFYLPGLASASEVKDFVKTMLSSLHPVGVEYYRDLSKHARRKRSRNIVPPPTVQPPPGTSQPLPLRAWNLRYEFKLGIFAEFRQEMDAALRNYEAAYENLFGVDVLEAIPAWSPRFDEARMLADVLAIRIIRCLLWIGQTTGAAKWWSEHRNHVRDLVKRRAGGIETYTWETWQSIWAKTMSTLISRSQILPPTDFDKLESIEKSILVHSEKTLASNDRFAPWESLHHEGYWLNLAQRYTRERRTRAQKMPEEDRASPGQSPASAIANRAKIYDRYMSLEPHVENPVDDVPGYNYTNDITQSLDAATQHFSHHSQIRMIQVLQLQKAMELMRSSLWEDAVAVLTPLWQDPMLRTSGWWNILTKVGQALWICAGKSKDPKLLIQMKWERAHPLLNVNGDSLNSHTDISNQADVQPGVENIISSHEHLSIIGAHFAFAAAECHVGENINIQVTLQHLMANDPRILRPSEVQIHFEGPLKSIYIVDNGIQHNNDKDEDSVNKTTIEDLQFADIEDTRSDPGKDVAENPVSILVAKTNLSLRSGSNKVYQLKVEPREAGEVAVASMVIKFTQKEYEQQIAISSNMIASENWWELRSGQATRRRCGKDRNVGALNILPKPPKLDISVPELKKVYYTNEDIKLTIELSNQEDEVINGSIDARLISASKNTARISWTEHKEGQGQEQTETNLTHSTELVQALHQKQFTNLGIKSQLTMGIMLDTTQDAIDHELEIAVAYTLPSGPQTFLHKQLTIDLVVIKPFEANFGFHSRYHEEPWPGFFSISSIPKDKTQAAGLKQQFSVSALVCSFALDEILIKDIFLNSLKVLGDASCTTSKGILRGSTVQDQSEAIPIRPEQSQLYTCDMIIQKHTLGDRQPVAVDLVFQIVWKRASEKSEAYHTSSLPVPRFLAPSSEPRVLLQVETRSVLDKHNMSIYELTYTLENPSLHFLTFNLVMEASEDFAFSGPKSDSISLVPISRSNVKYQLMPIGKTKTKEENTDKDGSEWMKVHLDVVDAYFGQTLRVQPASDGVRVDKQGNILIKMV